MAQAIVSHAEQFAAHLENLSIWECLRSGGRKQWPIDIMEAHDIRNGLIDAAQLIKTFAAAHAEDTARIKHLEQKISDLSWSNYNQSDR